jgi:hypothetical protein
MLLIVLAIPTLAAHAQGPGPDSLEKIEEIIVTGSHVRGDAGEQIARPVDVISAALPKRILYVSTMCPAAGASIPAAVLRWSSSSSKRSPGPHLPRQRTDTSSNRWT